MKTRIVIDRQRLDTGEPAIVVVDDEGGVRYANEVKVLGTSTLTSVGKSEGPKVGSARVWLETDATVICN